MTDQSNATVQSPTIKGGGYMKRYAGTESIICQLNAMTGLTWAENPERKGYLMANLIADSERSFAEGTVLAQGIDALNKLDIPLTTTAHPAENGEPLQCKFEIAIIDAVNKLPHWAPRATEEKGGTATTFCR